MSAASWTCEVEQNRDRGVKELILLPILLQLVKHHCLSHSRSLSKLSSEEMLHPLEEPPQEK